MSHAEQKETNSASEDSPQLVYVRVSTDTFETEPKSRMWKWFACLCTCIVIVGTIISDYIRKIKMITIKKSGWETKGLAATGGVVSPSLRQKKLSILLAVMVMACFKLRRYGE